MDTPLQVERMTDEQVLASFGTAEDAANRGFDEATYTRVLAYELVRARRRLANYRALYTSFAEVGKPYMIENLDDAQDGAAVPAKLVFSDDAEHVSRLEETADVIVWTEPEILDELMRERAVQDFLTDLLDELVPALQGS